VTTGGKSTGLSQFSISCKQFSREYIRQGPRFFAVVFYGSAPPPFPIALYLLGRRKTMVEGRPFWLCLAQGEHGLINYKDTKP
jgi:hypothetical protein